MNAKEFVDSLFTGYEETAALADFKEELLGNLNAKIESFIRKGMNTEAAFEKACAELGDVSALADELSEKKRKEVIEEAYMGIGNYMTARRVAAYVIFGIIALFGFFVAFFPLFVMGKLNIDFNLGLIAFFGTMLPFLTAAVAGFTFLGVTQETNSTYPVSGKRGAWYTVAAALIAFGLLVMPVIYFSVTFGWNIVDFGIGEIRERFFNEWNVYDFGKLSASFLHPFSLIISVVSPLIVFVLPGGGLLAFLILSEKNRYKPWAKNLRTTTS